LTVNNTPVSNLQLALQASSISEGSSASLSGSFVNPSPVDAHTVVITWGDGSASTTLSLAAGVLTFSGVTHPYQEESAGQPGGSYPISVTVSDGEGGQSNAQTSLLVNDAALAATGLSFSGQEGIGLTATLASFTDADPGGTPADYTATINWGDGSTASSGTVGVSGTTFTVSGGHTYDEEGTYTVRVTIQDQGGSTITLTSTASIAVVAPTAASSGPADGVPGQPRTFTFAASHPSQADTAAGFIYNVTWGDGTTQTIPRTPGNGAGVAVDHVYTTPGSYTVGVSATEDGGSTSAAFSRSLTVQAVEYQKGTDTLAVGGTLGNDSITISPADAAGDLTVNVNGTTSFNGTTLFKPTGHILVYGQTGNDTIQLVGNKIQGTTYYVSVPAYLYGGGAAGDRDILDASGSRATNVLMGGAGSNKLFGGLGRDLLIAGLGVSQLHAGSGEDILIGGWTDYDLSSTALTYDRKLAALDALMREWGRTDLGTASDPTGYAARVNHLLGPAAGGTSGGLNGSVFLNPATVHDNGQADTLFGTTGAALDWFFAGPSDVVKNRTANEVVTPIS
jgi:hypothetical protein